MGVKFVTNADWQRMQQNVQQRYRSQLAEMQDPNSQYNNGGFWGGLGYMGEKFGLGALRMVEGAADTLATGAASASKIQAGDAQMTNAGWAQILGWLTGSDKLKDYAESQRQSAVQSYDSAIHDTTVQEAVLGNDWVDYTHADKWFNPGKGWQVAGDVAGGIGSSVPMIALGAITGGVGNAIGLSTLATKALASGISLGFSALGSAGSSMSDAYKETGVYNNDVFKYGVLSGVTEAGVEALSMGLGVGTGRIFNAVIGASKGVAATVGATATRSVLKNIGKAAGGLLLDGISEGVEEGVASIMSPIYQQWTYNPDAKINWNDVWYESMIGAMSGMVMGGFFDGARSAKRQWNAFSAGNKISREGTEQQWIDIAKETITKDVDTGYARTADVRSALERVEKSLSKTDGKAVSKAQQYLVGTLKQSVVSAAVEQEVVASAMNAVKNADAMAEYYNGLGVKDANGAPITITVQEILDGIDPHLIAQTDAKSQKALQKQVAKSVSKGGVLSRLAVVNTVNASIAQSRAANANSIVNGEENITAETWNRAVETLDADQLNEIAYRLGIDPKAATASQVRDALAAAQMARETVQNKKTRLPLKLPKEYPQGAHRYTLPRGREDITIVRDGDLFYLYDHGNDRLMASGLDIDAVNALLDDDAKFEAKKTEEKKKAPQSEDKKEGGLNAATLEDAKVIRENIKEYSEKSAKDRTTLRRIYRQAIAHGYSQADALVYTAVAARSGLNIVFDKTRCIGEFTDKNGKVTSRYANGFYSESRDTIVINPDAKAEVVLIHELDHKLRTGYSNGRMSVKIYGDAIKQVPKDKISAIESRYEKVDTKLESKKAQYEDETNAYYAEMALGNMDVLRYLVDGRSALERRILSFFKKASTDYKGVPKLEGYAKKYLKQYKAAFEALAAENRSVSLAETVDDALAAAQMARTDAKKGGNAASKKGKVFINGKEYTIGEKTGLGGIRDASVKGVSVLTDALGANVHFYESYLDRNGKRVYRDADGNVQKAPHGFYDPADGSIHIDLNAGKMGEGVVLYTVAHEMTHFIRDWSPAKFKVFADFLLENYAKKGVSVEALVQGQIQKAAKNGRDISFDEAYEEVIADSCQAMLTDGKAIQKIAELKAKDATLWQKIKDFLSGIVAKVKRAYAGLDPYSEEGRFVKDKLDVFEQLQSMWVDALVDAGETYSEVRDALGEDSTIKVNEDGEFLMGKTSDGKILLNDRTWDEGGREILRATLALEGYSTEDIDAALTIMDGKHQLVEQLNKEFIEQDKISKATLTTDLKTGKAILSALVSNGDYPVNIDLLMVCKKRQAYQRVINRLCETGLIKQATLDSLAIAEINKILGKYGFETACLGCFVESRRIRIQEWAETICKEWNGIVDKMVGKGKATSFNFASETFVNDLSDAEIDNLADDLDAAYERDGLHYGRTTVVKKMEQLLREVPSLRKHLSVADLITPQGRTHLKQLSSELNSLVACRYGSNTPKIVQDFNPYNHELAQYGTVPKKYNSLREYLYAIGGARMQSFSDFIVENWFDYCQIVADLAARKLPMHTYTKEIVLAKLFGMTGIKINMSLIPDIDKSMGKEYAGLTRNAKGELELIWGDKDRFKATGGKSYMQSINFADAVALQNDPRYSANIGTIAVGVSDKHIEMMLDDPRIRMIIPYHSSGMNPIFANLVGTEYYTDYTDVQNATVKQLYDSKGNAVTIKLEKSQKDNLTHGFDFNAVLQELGDARAAAKAYLEWCADASKHSITIKGETYTAVLTPEFEQFSGHENYYKVIEDFNTYDSITEQAAPQGDVQQIYPDNFEDILRDELTVREKYRQKQEPKWDAAMGEIESYLKKHTKKETIDYAKEHGIKLSKKDMKLSDRDSEGGSLSAAQQEFFKDSKVRDSEGRLTPVYHGTPNGGFTEFKLPFYLKALTSAQGAGFYFTDKANASQYMKGLNGKSVSKKQLYKVYLNITNPLEISEYSKGAISDEAFRRIMARGNYEWGMAHTDIDKTLRYATLDSDRLAEMVRVFNGEEILTVMKEELGYDGVRFTDKYGDVWVAWDKSQIKNTTNKAPTSNPDIRYALPIDLEGISDTDAELLSALTLDDFLAEIDDFEYGSGEMSVSEVSEKLNVEPKTIRILSRRAGLGDAYVADRKRAVMTQKRIDEEIQSYGATNPTYAQRYITEISTKDFIDLTVRMQNLDRDQFDTNVRGDYGGTMADYDYMSALPVASTPYFAIDKATGQITGHNGRHRIRALEMAGIKSVEIEIELHDEDGRIIKYGAETIPDLAISSQFDTGIETHLYNVIPLNNSHRAEIESTYGEKAHKGAAVQYSLPLEPATEAEVKQAEELQREIPTKKRGKSAKERTEAKLKQYFSTEGSYEMLRTVYGLKDLSPKSIQGMSNQIWQALNASVSADEKALIAWNTAGYILDRLMTTDLTVENPAAKTAMEELAYLRTGVGRLKFADTDVAELKHAFGKDGMAKIRGRWGYKGKGAAYPMEQFVVDIAREMPGMAYIEEMHPAEAFKVVMEKYDAALETSKEKWISELDGASDIELDSIRNGLAQEILDGFDYLGAESSYSRLESQLENFRVRAERYKLKNELLQDRTKAEGRLMRMISNLRDVKVGRFANATQPDMTERLKGVFNALLKIDFRGTLSVGAVRTQMRELAKWYEDAKTSIIGFKSPEDPGLYNGDIDQAMLSIASKPDSEKISNQEIKDLFDIVSYFRNVVNNYGKVWRAGKLVDADEVARGYIDKAKPSEVKIGNIRAMQLAENIKSFQNYVDDIGTVVARADGFREGGFYTEIHNEIREAEMRAELARIDALKEHDEFTKKNPKYLYEAGKQIVKFDGKQITKMHLMSLYMTCKRQQAWRGIALSGYSYTVPGTSLKQEFKDGLLDQDATDAEIETFIQNKLAAIERHLSKQDKEYVRILEKAYNGTLRDMKMKRDFERQGYSNVADGYYYPIKRGAMPKTAERQMQDAHNSFNNSAFNRDTVEKASQELEIQSAESLFQLHVKAVSNYANVGAVVDEFNVLYNLDVSGNRNRPTSIQTVTHNAWPGAHEYFFNLFSDIKGTRQQSELNKVLGAVRGKYAVAALALNAKVLFTQVSSLFASTNVLDWSSLLAVVNPMNKKHGITNYADEAGLKEVDRYCDLARLRNADNSAARAQGGVDGAISKFGEKMMMGIGWMDRNVVCIEWRACQIQIAKNMGKGYEVGTEKNKVEAGKLLTKVIQDTQQSSLKSERTAAMRSPEQIMRGATMFTADAVKMLGRLLSAAGEYNALSKMIKTETNVEARNALLAQRKLAGKKIGRSAIALGTTSAYLALLSFAFDAFFGRLDDDEENEAIIGLATDFASGFVAGIPIIKDIVGFAFDGFELSDMSFDSLNGLLSASKSALSLIGKENRTKQDVASAVKNVAFSISQMIGVPTRNLYNLLYGTLNLTGKVGVDAAVGWRYEVDSFFKKTNLESDLKKAVENDDDVKTDYILNLISKESFGSPLSKSATEELRRLAKSGYTALPKSIGDTVKINGVEYKLTTEQQTEISKYYREALPSLNTLVESKAYSDLSIVDKEKAIEQLMSVTYDDALCRALDLEEDNGVLTSRVVGASTYALYRVKTSRIDSTVVNGVTVSGSKRRKVVAAINAMDISDVQKVLLLYKSGYSVADGEIGKMTAQAARARLAIYLNTYGGDAYEKEELAKMCKMSLKNGKFLLKTE
jgi:hypothetical protein